MLNEFENKINFISSFKKDSPLFLRTAQNFILQNDYQSAIVALKKGLNKFPGHPVAHILLGRAFLLSRNYELADTNFKIAADLINSEKTYEYYSNEFRNINRFTLSRENFSKNKSSLDKLEKSTANENRKEQFEEAKAVEERLEQLATVLSTARIDRVKEDGAQNSDTLYRIPERSKIISETLAKIYVSQGERSEAIKVYEQLIKMNPLKESYYLQKIKEIGASQEF
ncbi:MAG: tetratricopeptide repeat protein [Ignavibacteria bacterium]|nr:tetratricopeptide repeat protein [Ignavibacteria bacterium]MBT8391439.1 tetratricopeptide repeat protein [Ignavibacteria bacterium]NNJ51950.1 tetratricopeptide repeat protein [Ignavibacteriaceae bacterium]NNL21471.1 tetratricopeptide repeat protein [Ignavibacteriaceae bacterium]